MNKMAGSVLEFYDRLASDYHLLFEDWQQAVLRQGEVLDQLLRAQGGNPPLVVLDCCCGVGTQAIGLALRGFRVHATDLSALAIERAAREAQTLGATVTFGVADVRKLADQVAGVFDVILACDNALPHLLSDSDLQQAVIQMAAKLRPGGLFLASTRDYDTFVKERPRTTPSRVFDDATGRRVVFQVWDWSPDGRTYTVNQFIVKQTGNEWQTAHYATTYRALLREEFNQALHGANLTNIRWYMPEESGYYQPLVTAHKA
jgi:2-polyprenyl-3-methyl-5-hydroxy-6-metoxy-1,4-benzoquinol methylase